jgi:hypothetical protein
MAITSVAECPRFRGTGLIEYSAGIARIIGLDARELDHLGPLLDFVGDELAEFGGRHSALACRPSRATGPSC